MPITTAEGRELAVAFQALPDRTASARLAYTALTSPAHPSAHAPEQFRHDLNAEQQPVTHPAPPPAPAPAPACV